MTDDIAPRAAIDDPAADAHLERARLKKAAKAMGWKLIGRDMAEVRIERSFVFGPRTVSVRGRVGIELPDQISVERGNAALAPIVDPVVEKFRYAMEQAARKLLSAPDDVERRYVFEKTSFFSALEDARRGLVADWQNLENERLDARVEADLGLRFYLESLTTQERSFE